MNVKQIRKPVKKVGNTKCDVIWSVLTKCVFFFYLYYQQIIFNFWGRTGKTPELELSNNFLLFCFDLIWFWNLIYFSVFIEWLLLLLFAFIVNFHCQITLEKLLINRLVVFKCYCAKVQLCITQVIDTKVNCFVLLFIFDINCNS